MSKKTASKHIKNLSPYYFYISLRLLHSNSSFTSLTIVKAILIPLKRVKLLFTKKKKEVVISYTKMSALDNSKDSAINAKNYSRISDVVNAPIFILF